MVRRNLRVLFILQGDAGESHGGSRCDLLAKAREQKPLLSCFFLALKLLIRGFCFDGFSPEYFHVVVKFERSS